MNQAIADADRGPVPVTLSNGQSWGGGPTFNLLRRTNVLRNLGSLDRHPKIWTRSSSSPTAPRSQTYTQLETGSAITAAPTR